MTLSFLCYILSLNIVVCVLFFCFFKLFMFTNLQTKKIAEFRISTHFFTAVPLVPVLT